MNQILIQDSIPAHCDCPDHDDSFCCNCGHFHQGDCPDRTPACGDRRCCIN